MNGFGQLIRIYHHFSNFGIEIPTMFSAGLGIRSQYGSSDCTCLHVKFQFSVCDFNLIVRYQCPNSSNRMKNEQSEFVSVNARQTNVGLTGLHEKYLSEKFVRLKPVMVRLKIEQVRYFELSVVPFPCATFSLWRHRTLSLGITENDNRRSEQSYSVLCRIIRAFS